MDDIDRIQDHMESRLEANLSKALSNVPKVAPGQIAPEFCASCDDEIPMARRVAVPWTDKCSFCQGQTELAARRK